MKRPLEKGMFVLCDEEGNVNQDFPRAFWTNTFTEKDEVTTVDILITYVRQIRHL